MKNDPHATTGSDYIFVAILFGLVFVLGFAVSAFAEPVNIFQMAIKETKHDRWLISGGNHFKNLTTGKGYAIRGLTPLQHKEHEAVMALHDFTKDGDSLKDGLDLQPFECQGVDEYVCYDILNSTGQSIETFLIHNNYAVYSQYP